jgi:hypothetical protein
VGPMHVSFWIWRRSQADLVDEEHAQRGHSVP